jgi:hypothetical protein
MKNRQRLSLTTIMLISCAVVLPTEAAVEHIVLTPAAEQRADDAFGDIAYGEGDYGNGMPSVAPASSTTTMPVTAITPESPTAPSTTTAPPVSTSTTGVIEAGSPQSNNESRLVDLPPSAPAKQRTSLTKWVMNPLGELLERHTENFPRWAKDLVIKPLATAGYLWLPLLLGFGIWTYLRYQHRFDANEEKITDAPMFDADPVQFEDD